LTCWIDWFIFGRLGFCAPPGRFDRNCCTILRITSLGIECHLEDKRAGRGGHQWTIGPGEAARILKTRDYSVNPTYRASSGLFAIGRRKNWLYLKKLFPEPEYLHGTLTDLLEQAAKDADN